MTDLDIIREMIAKKNMRYSIMVSTQGSAITVQGHRDQNPLRVRAVAFEFTTDGDFITLRGDA